MTASTADEPIVMRTFTGGMRIPTLIGKLPHGGRIWGGPYTGLQFTGGGLVIVVGANTMTWWAQFGVVANIVLAVGVPVMTVLVLGRVRPGGRNPVSSGVGLLRAGTRPRWGSHQGRPVPAGRPRRTRQRLLLEVPLTYPVLACASGSAAVPLATTHSVPAAQAVVSPDRPAQVARPVVLTGVQRLLAAAPAAERRPA